MRKVKFLLLLGVLHLSACTTTSSLVSVSSAEVDRLLTGEALFGARAAEFSLPEEDLFALTDEMKAFADASVGADMGASYRAIELQRALLMPGALGLSYNPYVTSTAAEAFAVQEGNCLTFTALYYSLARYLGIKAYINEVDVPASWDLKGDNTYVFFRHVNVKVKLPGGKKMVVDLDMDNYQARYRQRRITKDALRVQYFNNRAMELLTTGNSEGAFLSLKKAISLDADKAYLWSNLGILFKRNHLLPQSEVAFRKALVVEPGNSTVAASNLARLYKRLGKPDKASQFERLVSSYRYKNPYFQFHLAEESLAAGNLDEALKRVRKAIRGVEGEARFYDLQAKIYVRLGKLTKAQKSLDKAVEVAKPNARQVYRRRAQRLNDRIQVY